MPGSVRWGAPRPLVANLLNGNRLCRSFHSNSRCVAQLRLSSAVSGDERQLTSGGLLGPGESNNS